MGRGVTVVQIGPDADDRSDGHGPEPIEGPVGSGRHVQERQSGVSLTWCHDPFTFGEHDVGMPIERRLPVRRRARREEPDGHVISLRTMKVAGPPCMPAN